MILNSTMAVLIAAFSSDGPRVSFDARDLPREVPLLLRHDGSIGAMAALFNSDVLPQVGTWLRFLTLIPLIPPTSTLSGKPRTLCTADPSIIEATALAS